ncbi:hypothetical protein SLEP1_g47290 [Rubroshorea leprosula]|uniref:CASP-like protein n=1 Tax=Rubroshorea leprosula TaxID=152421 RepID=A0AAV5LSL8_9ROSI|nr:hypothetical protein SLEP1_g47290 [Rubroshorea leprosula]
MRSNLENNSPNTHIPILKFLDCSLRLSVVPLSVATIWITVTNDQENSTYGTIKFSNLLGLKYMVFISAICAGYAFVAVVASWFKCLVSKAWIFFVSDQVFPQQNFLMFLS